MGTSCSNILRVGYDRMEQIREGVSGDGLEGKFLGRGTAAVYPVAT